MKDKQELSIIIPTKNRKELLTNCLRSLLNQSRLPGEIVVIDNSLLKTAKEITTSFQKKTSIRIRYLHQLKIGSPYVRNLGIKAANYDILAFIDDDCVADKDWVEEIFKAHRKYNSVVIKGRNLNGMLSNVYACVEHFSTEMIFESQHYKSNGIVYSRLLDTKNFSVRKSLLKKYYLFFDKLFAPFSILEDLDLARRIRKIGINIIYNPKMVVWHYGRTDLVSHLKREFNKGRAFFNFQKKWAEEDKKTITLIKINYFYKNNHKWKKRLLTERKKIKKVEKRLIKEILRRKKKMFIPLFYIISWLSRIIIRLGYFHEKLNQKNNLLPEF